MFKLFFADYKSEIKKQHDWKVISFAEIIILSLAIVSMFPLLSMKNLSNPMRVIGCLFLMVVFLALEHFWAAPRTRRMYGKSQRAHQMSNDNDVYVGEAAHKSGHIAWFLERRVKKARELVEQHITDLGIENEVEFIDYLVAECDRALSRTKRSKMLADNLKPVIPMIGFILVWSIFALYRISPSNFSSDEIWKEAFSVLTQSAMGNTQLLMQFVALMVLIIFVLLYSVLIVFPVLSALVDYDWTLVEDLRSALIYLKQASKSTVLQEELDDQNKHHVLHELAAAESNPR